VRTIGSVLKLCRRDEEIVDLSLIKVTPLLVSNILEVH
jgi:hypothetical protein